METETLIPESQGQASPLADLQPKTQFTGKVLKTTLAGAIVDIGLEVPGVVHISQLQAEPVKRVEEVVQVGQEVEVWVRQVFPKKNRVELTMIKPLDLDWKEIQEEMTVKGKVTRLEKFGVFVDIGAERPGLVHISEMAHGYVKDPADVVKEGDEIEVKVLKVSRRKRQIKLSMKALLPEPPVQERPARKPRTEGAEGQPAASSEDRGERRPRREGRDNRGGERGERGEGRPRRAPRTNYEDLMPKDENEPPVPTAMEIALREAMERNREDDEPYPGSNRQSTKRKGGSSNRTALEDILARTLENKVRSTK